MTVFTKPCRAQWARSHLLIATALALVATALALVAALTHAPPAFSNHFHATCVGHGFVHGESTTDNSFHSRVNDGCGNPGRKSCRLVTAYGTVFKEEFIAAGVAATCNVWSNYEYGEFASTARVDFNNVFSLHDHHAH
jgi:hypothetical protein